jgi:hypothetical protein
VEHLGGWSYLSGLLVYLIPILILLISRRDFRSYGITLENWRYSLDLAMSVFPIKLLPWLLGIGAILVLDRDYTDISIALILSTGNVLALAWLFLALKRTKQKT